MSRTMVTLLLCACGLAWSQPSVARVMTARIDKVESPAATLDKVTVRLEWPGDAGQGDLHLHARTVSLPGLGYEFRDISWRCPLQRSRPGGWRCDGAVQAPGGRPLRLSVDLGTSRTEAALSRGPARISLRRRAGAPDLSTIDLAAVPVSWAQALVARAWDAPRLQGGTLDARLQLLTPATSGALQVDGTLAITGLDFDTPDGRIAGQGLGGRFDLDYRKQGDTTRVLLDGSVQGGELLAGSTYAELSSAVPVHVEAVGREGQGWQVPRFSWHDAGVLEAEGSAAFAADASLRDLDLRLRSGQAGALAGRYLSGWLGPAGLGDLALGGAMDLDLRVDAGRLREATATLRGVDATDPGGRFGFRALDGEVRFTGGDAAVSSHLRWQGGELYGLAFGAARLPLESSAGALRLREPVAVPVLGGSVRFDGLEIRPPSGGESLAMRFGMTLEGLDIGRLSSALGWPAFQGTLSGRIPDARYAGNRLDFDGGLTMDLFEGSVRVSSLSMERPFGSAPTLAADVRIDDLDLMALTSVFGFGSISGRLDGRIDDLRLVDWQATAFDAELRTDRKRGVRQRISQRAVQNISSVGDASFVDSLQGRLIGLFDDFGYNRIGISCRLRNEVCEMGGLRSGGNTFTIVSGAGLPRLTVIGHNRLVDWPVLVERLAAVAEGEVKPVVE